MGARNSKSELSACCGNKSGKFDDVSNAFAPVVSDRENAQKKKSSRKNMASEYKGQWKDGKRHGQGELVLKDGSVYEGSFCEGVADGFGVFKSVNGDIYEGEWVKDQAHGHGKHSDSKGNTYEGEWKNDCRDGQGVESWSDGAHYAGQYVQGTKHGIASYSSGKGDMYAGQFRSDRMDGVGSYKFPDGRTFTGQWKQGKMHGRGKMEWLNGNQYEGEFENDIKQGTGLFTWADGRAYDGQWVNGKQHGTADLISKDGQRSGGEWREGKPFIQSAEEAGEETTVPDSDINTAASVDMCAGVDMCVQTDMTFSSQYAVSFVPWYWVAARNHRAIGNLLSRSVVDAAYIGAVDQSSAAHTQQHDDIVRSSKVTQEEADHLIQQHQCTVMKQASDQKVEGKIQTMLPQTIEEQENMTKVAHPEKLQLLQQENDKLQQANCRLSKKIRDKKSDKKKVWV